VVPQNNRQSRASSQFNLFEKSALVIITMAIEQHASRHYIGLQAQRVRWLPCAPAEPPDHQGRANASNLFVLGGWHQDSERSYLWVADLQTSLLGDGGAQVERAESSVQAAWQTPAKVADVKVGDLGGGEVMVLVGCYDGSLSYLKLFTPREPGAPVADVKVVGGCSPEESTLAPWLPALHHGRVASVDICVSTQQILTCGDDGRLHVLPAGAERTVGHPPSPFYDNAGAASFYSARWCSGELRTFVTASTSGGLACWDTRQGPRPVRRSPQSWSSGPILSVEVHSQRQHLCVTGGARGEVALWDLRFTSQPLVHKAGSAEQTDIWEVKFDESQPLADGGCDIPPVMFCTESGTLAKVGKPSPQPHQPFATTAKSLLFLLCIPSS